MDLVHSKERKPPKIALLRPPFYEIEGSRGHSMDIPLGLLSIAAVLKARHYDVVLYDCRVEGADCAVRRNGDKGHWLGASWEEIAAFIRLSSPDIVGISCPFTTQAEAALRLAEVVKTVDGKIITVMGGPHASSRPEAILEQSSFVDLVVMGEGEYCLFEIAESYEGKRPLSGIKGLVYRNGDRIVSNGRRSPIRRLDELPLPAYHLVDLEKYFALKKETADNDMSRPRFNYPGSERSLPFITSRGCPFNCVFCSIHLHMGKAYRAHSARYVLDHLEHLVKTHGVNHFHFEDDNLTLDRERFYRILDGIEKRNIQLTWDTPNGVRADTLDREILRKCKRTGCVYLILGTESGDQYVLDHIVQKKLSLSNVFEVAERACEVGIDMRSFFIIGFPGETMAQIQTTLTVALRMYKKFRVQPSLMFATPLLGTRLFDICLREGYLTGPVTPASLAVSTSRKGMIRTEDFDPDELCILRDRFNRKTKWIHFAHFVKGLFRSPRLFLYIFWNALNHTKRARTVCADTVLFYHFLKSRRQVPLRKQDKLGSPACVLQRKSGAARSNVA